MPAWLERICAWPLRLSVWVLTALLKKYGHSLRDFHRTLFIEWNREGVTGRLTRICLSRSESERFLVISDRERPEAYVQCTFCKGDTQIVLEASSGFFTFMPDGGRRKTPESRLKIIEEAGFSTDGSAGNYHVRYSLHDRLEDFDRIADILLGLMYDAYGVYKRDGLDFYAPLAMPREEEAPARQGRKKGLSPRSPRC